MHSDLYLFILKLPPAPSYLGFFLNNASLYKKGHSFYTSNALIGGQMQPLLALFVAHKHGVLHAYALVQSLFKACPNKLILTNLGLQSADKVAVQTS